MSNKIEYKNSVQIIAQHNSKYIKKKKNKEKNQLFKYLNNQNFINYLPPKEENDNYEFYQYIREKSINEEEKAITLIHTISDLHNKTSSYKSVDKEYIDNLYNTTKEKLLFLRKYYYELQDDFETKEFPSPEEQLLLNNISNIYKALDYSEYKLNLWYKKIKHKNNIRYVQLHNNLSLSHLLVGNQNYLISWDDSKQGLPVYDFIMFYKNEFRYVDMKNLFNLYQRKYKYTEEEQLLFEALVSIPPKLVFKKNHLINTIEAKKHLDYVEMTSSFLSKDNKEYQENDK